MGLYKKLAADLEEVDIIIAGGGTAGCIIAGRLAEADPELSILVVEGGPDNYDNPNVIIPGFYYSHLQPNSETTIFYTAAKSRYTGNVERIVPSGGTLGGGSSINFMMYTRAQRDDYDSWKTPGWSADELWPYLKKLETYHGPGKPEHHGYDGPIQVSDGPFRCKRVEDEWLHAAAQFGYPEIIDLQNLDTNNGWQRWLRYMSPEGKRSDTAHGYLHPMLRDGKHPNLHVLVETKVVRVLFDEDKRACGVEFTPNPRYQVQMAFATPHPKQIVRARKLVVVSCGACGTPSVLQRSGVGPKDVLDRAGVPIVEELPGVGHGYQDHNLIAYVYQSSLDPLETSDALVSGRLSYKDAEAQKHPHLGWNFIDLSSKLRPTDEEVAALGPEFQAMWDKDFKNQPNRPLMLMAVNDGVLGDSTGLAPGQYLSVAPYTAYPYSRGHLHITGPDISDPLDFDLGFFSDANDIDLKKQVWGYKKGREIIRRTGIYRGEVPSRHPRFPEGSKAVALEEWSPPVEGSKIQDLEYSPEDDAAIEEYLRENIQTTWHSLGTAKMAPREEMGVVDKDLNVYGVRGLKVADLSIPPENVAANTNNTAMAIGEKAADIIAKELGIVIR
ncbi:GMC oxidoreductase [Annulohypoxylon maeteangense]|uniref:GMC oxidoreductase n=1 Tax=Annulohypoxylon maeteangense TaxID=1927788 RepID=UPI002008BF5A|nr:GMC oxidoreductase [Annulohypoxylon maeteangense]KAI0886954.1 GMC oxidoreductase [Annulohypoxylon maeteangense]